MEIDRAEVAQEEKLDGKWLVITNDTSLSAEDVALGYKQLIQVEESFRRLKHGVEIRRQLGRLKMVAYAGSTGRVLQTTEPTAEQNKLLKALKINAPKLVHHVG